MKNRKDANKRILYAISNPAVSVGGVKGISKIFTSLWTTIYIVGGLSLVLYFLFGSITYLTSSGDKDQLDKAKKTLSNAIAGLAILAVSYPIVVIIQKVLGIDILDIKWPTP